MGVLTAAQIIEQGTELAGKTYDASDAKPMLWLKQWLRSVVLGWPWSETEGFTQIVQAAGEHAVTLGMGGENLSTTYIHRIIFPFQLVYDGDYLPKKITQKPFDQSLVLSTDSIPEGVPDKASYKRDFEESGQILIIFDKIPTEALTYELQYQFDPAATMETTDVPWYANDITMIQAVAFKTSEYHDGPDAETTVAFGQALSQMIKDDRVKLGNVDAFTMPLTRRFGG